MIGKAMEKALNGHVGEELYSAHLYLAMSAWCDAANLPGFAKWLRAQYEEERAHALKLFDYLLGQGAKVELPAVGQPPARFKSVLDVFQQVVAHEKKVTAAIHALVALAVKEGDYATQGELQWFVKEQVEEERNAQTWAAHLGMIGDKSAAILNLDHRAGKRGA